VGTTWSPCHSLEAGSAPPQVHLPWRLDWRCLGQPGSGICLAGAEYRAAGRGTGFYEVHASSLQIVLGHHEKPTMAAPAPISMPTDRFDLLLEGGRIGLRRCYRPGWPVTHMHLIAGGLRWLGCYQPGLFDAPADSKAVVADRIKREVNERHGRFAVRSGQTLFLPEMYRDPSHSFDVCDIRGKMCF
jgi:DNA polymerase V